MLSLFDTTITVHIMVPKSKLAKFVVITELDITNIMFVNVISLSTLDNPIVIHSILFNNQLKIKIQNVKI